MSLSFFMAGSFAWVRADDGRDYTPPGFGAGVGWVAGGVAVAGGLIVAGGVAVGVAGAEGVVGAAGAGRVTTVPLSGR